MSRNVPKFMSYNNFREVLVHDGGGSLNGC